MESVISEMKANHADMLKRVDDEFERAKKSKYEEAVTELSVQIAQDVNPGDDVHSFLAQAGFAEKHSKANKTGTSKVSLR